jgi:hypothetical protein
VWQGALRDVNDDAARELAAAAVERRTFTIDLLYSDQVGGQRTMSRFAVTPVGDDRRLCKRRTALEPRPGRSCRFGRSERAPIGRSQLPAHRAHCGERIEEMLEEQPRMGELEWVAAHLAW